MGVRRTSREGDRLRQEPALPDDVQTLRRCRTQRSTVWHVMIDARVSPGRETDRVNRCDEGEVVLADGLGQGRDNRAGVVVGPRYVERGTVLAEGDRAVLRPWSEMLCGR